MEHWAQKCDGAGVDPAEYAAVCKERDDLRPAYDGAQLALKALNEKLAEVTAERDAAVDDMRGMLDNCKACLHAHDAPADCDFECLSCEKKCACADCRDGICFEWRGAKKEEA